MAVHIPSFGAPGRAKRDRSASADQRPRTSADQIPMAFLCFCSRGAERIFGCLSVSSSRAAVSRELDPSSRTRGRFRVGRASARALRAFEVVDFFWPESPGSAALPPGVPIYRNELANTRHDAPGYNVAVSDGPAILPLDIYHKLACFEGSLDANGRPLRTACVWIRSGGCTPGAASPPTTNWPDYFLNADGSPLHRPDHRTYTLSRGL